jgi:threonine synthase
MPIGVKVFFDGKPRTQGRAKGKKHFTMKMLQCMSCGKEWPLGNVYRCPSCSRILDVVGYGCFEVNEGLPGIWRYFSELPLTWKDSIVSLGEGNTPLLRSAVFGEKWGIDLFFKLEFLNPSGSFKDRGISVAVSKAKELGSEGLFLASSGNAATAAAAYAAKAGMECVVFVSASISHPEKIARPLIYGAKIIRINLDYGGTHAITSEFSRISGWTDLTTNFVNPYNLEGNKTEAYELVAQFHGKAPDYVVVPTGAGAHITGMYKGFSELFQKRLIEKKPRMVSVQTQNCCPIVSAYESGAEEVTSWSHSFDTNMHGIADPLLSNPFDGTRTLSVIKESEGVAVSINEDTVDACIEKLAEYEGLYVEPTSASVMAGVEKLVTAGCFEKNAKVVAVLTGRGLRVDDSPLHDTPCVSSLGALRELWSKWHKGKSRNYKSQT